MYTWRPDADIGYLSRLLSTMFFKFYYKFLGVCAHAHEPVAPHKLERSENSFVELVPCVHLHVDFRDPAEVARLARAGASPC